MADTAKLAEQCKKAEDKVLERQAAVEANIALQQEVTDLKRKQHWDQLKAREDVFCAQQQLEAGRTALKDAMSTMENRISTLTTQGQVSYSSSVAHWECVAGQGREWASHKRCNTRKRSNAIKQNLHCSITLI